MAVTSCEKDDICVDGDTPLLVINFYDIANPETGKNVQRLRVVGIGNGEPVSTFSDRSSRDSIGLPLNAAAAETGFELIYNSQSDDDGLETGNPDTLYFIYQVQDNYISRACGFIPAFENLEYRLQADSNIWIDSVVIENPSVRSTSEIHVAIYH